MISKDNLIVNKKRTRTRVVDRKKCKISIPSEEEEIILKYDQVANKLDENKVVKEINDPMTVIIN